ncbi:MAG: MFS transporter [Planctomycetota bacterium]|jgi:hypothetical protein|nr:MFS transporter [Planctomycetota bacterium]
MRGALARSVQKDGQRRLLRAMAVNPLGMALTVGPVVFLLALHYGASDLQMGLLYAAVYLGGLGALIAPRFLQGRNTTDIVAGSWAIRSGVTGGFILLPFLASENIKVVGILVVTYLVMGIRSAGVIALPPTIKALTNSRELPSVNAGFHLRWHIGNLAVSTVSFLVLSRLDLWPSEEWAYVGLLAVGTVFNIITAILLRGLPKTATLEQGDLGSLLRATGTVLRTPAYREVLIVTLLQIPMAIAAAYMMNQLKNSMGVSPAHIFMLSFCGVAVSAAIAKTLCVIGSSIRMRVLLFMAHALLMVLGAIWVWLDAFPVEWQLPIANVTYVFSTMALAGSGIILAALVAARLPEKDQVQVSTVYQLSSVVGALLGIGIIDLLGRVIDWNSIPGMHAYSHAFVLWLAMSIAICIFALLMRAGSTGAFTTELAQLSPANLFTIYRVHRLPTSANPSLGHMRELEGLFASATPASRELLLDTLRSPQARVRASALKMMGEAPIPAAFPMIRDEALSEASPLRGDAITSLGFIRHAEVIPLLEGFLNADDLTVVASAIKSLCRQGQAVPHERALACYRNCGSNRQRLDILFGVLALADRELMLALCAWEYERRSPPLWLRTVLQMVAELLGDPEHMAELFVLEQEQPSSGLRDLIADTNGTPCGLNGDQLLTWVEAGAWDQIASHGTFPPKLIPYDTDSCIGSIQLSRLLAS